LQHLLKSGHLIPRAAERAVPHAARAALLEMQI
jgi:hypothetical protein